MGKNNVTCQPANRLSTGVEEELLAGGAVLDQVSLVLALGVHRGMSADEVARRLDGDWQSQIAWHNLNGDDPQQMAFLGSTRRGTPMWVDKTIGEADLVISLGCIEPHIIASFGGGCKNLIPGVAGRASIDHAHALNYRPDTFNMVEQAIDPNVMNTDLRQGVKALANTIRAVGPGGAMITCIQAEEGVGVFGLTNRKLPLGKQALKTLASLLMPLVPKLNSREWVWIVMASQE